MKKTLTLALLLTTVTLFAQSFKDKVTMVEYKGSKTYPENLILEFNYQNSTLKVQGSNSGGTFTLSNIHENKYEGYITYTSSAIDPNGDKCQVGVFVYSDSKSIGILYPNSDNVQYWIFNTKSKSETKRIQQTKPVDLAKEKREYLEKYGITEYRKKYGY